MRVTVVQMSPGQIAEENVDAVHSLVERAYAADQPDLVVLPEMWSCLGGDADTKRASAETLPDEKEGVKGPLYAFLAETANRKGIVLHGGSIAERSGDRLYNTTLVFGPDGSELARYRKIHLFDVVTPGGNRYAESDLYGAGAEVATFRFRGITIGCAICYDLRFGYLFEALRQAGSELVLLPAAFTAETGEAHWEVMVRARAIESQSWVAASATTGRFFGGDGKPRSTYGHSMICDPWGRVTALAGDGPGWATSIVDHEVTAAVRTRMPVWQHRRALHVSSPTAA